MKSEQSPILRVTNGRFRAIIVSTAREPIGRADRGAFIDTQSHALGRHSGQLSSLDVTDPASHRILRRNGNSGWFGWSVIPELEALRSSLFAALGGAARKAICAEIQRVTLDEGAYILLGSSRSFTALRPNLTDRVSRFEPF